MIRNLAALAAALLLIAGAYAAGRPAAIEVAAGEPIAAMIADAPEGATIRLLPGTHPPFEVTRRVAVEAGAGAEVRGPIEIGADGVRLTGIRVVGGESGITIREAEGVRLEDVSVLRSKLHGIEVIDGSASIRGCRIGELRSPYGQGFEVRNSSGRPRTVVEGCTVSSGQEGLVAHVSRVEFRDNRVSGTSLRAIVVTEMSEGLVEGNLVTEATGVGLYCGDMSHCELRGNEVESMASDSSGRRSHAGYGAVAHYYSTMRLQDNTFQDLAAPEPVGLFLSSTQTDRFPLAVWPAGWRGAIPGLWVTAAALLGLALVRLALTPWLRRTRRQSGRRQSGRRAASGLALDVLAAGFVVQSFHMLEHFVQVFQVHVAESETRSGLAGATLDSEWVHFVYNAAAMAFLIWAWRFVRPGGPLAERVGAGAAFLGAAALIQAYHLTEHTAKMVQHLGSGLDPAPGLFGGAAGLVWFHYGINLAVYAGLAIPLITLAYRSLMARLRAARASAAPLERAASPSAG